MTNRFRATALLSVLFLAVVFPSSYAATNLRFMTLNAEWLVFTEDETDKDPWGPEYTLNEHYERIDGFFWGKNSVRSPDQILNELPGTAAVSLLNTYLGPRLEKRLSPHHD